MNTRIVRIHAYNYYFVSENNFFYINHYKKMPKNLLITGANGQLGNEMRNLLATRKNCFNSFFTDVETLDITDAKAVSHFIESNKIDMVVNCAAYTAVDRAEDDMVTCAKLNVDAVGNIAVAAHNFGARVLHVSTDYVFDGYNHRPYTEEDDTNPKTAYGTTKRDGEKLLLRLAPDSIVIRTAWLYSPYGHNFVKTMIKLGTEKEALNVVCDQIGTPTSAADLAAAIFTVISADEWHPGIYHFSDEGACSWYDFTKAIHRIAGIDTCKVAPVRSHEYPTRAIRPFYSILDKTKIKQTYGIEIPHWEESLEKCIKAIKNS